MSLLRAEIDVPARQVRAGIELAEGEVLALIGPNGAGKSTMLQAVAGVLPGSRVELDGRDVTTLPVHRRRIALLGQNARLFPHLTILDNVAFGPRSSGASRAAARARATEMLASVGAELLAARRVPQLSGGQAQRVAIARALAAEPALMLLDEPLAALDTEVAAGLRPLLRRVLRERSRGALVVTHDLVDAVALADRVAVVESGRIAETGSVREVLTRPRSRFGATFAGVNLVAGEMVAGSLRRGVTEVSGVAGPDRQLPADGSPALALFRPAAVSIHRVRPGGSPRNAFRVSVTALEAGSDGIRVRAHHEDLGAMSALITPAAAAELDLAPDSRVWFVVKAVEVELLPA